MNDKFDSERLDSEAPEFDRLQRLLTLKRYETPPPGFFDQLPSRIMARISTPSQSRWEEILDQLLAIRWVQRAAAAGMAVFVGGLFLAAVTQSGNGVPLHTVANLEASAPSPIPPVLAGAPAGTTTASLNNSLDMSLQPVHSSFRVLVP